MLDRGNEHSLLHQRRRVGHMSDVLGDSFDSKIIQIDPLEDNSSVGWSWKDAQIDRGTSMKTDAGKRDRRRQGLLVFQKSLQNQIVEYTATTPLLAGLTPET